MIETVPTIDVQSYAAERDSAKPPVLVDVREPHEADFCAIDGAILIPLGQLANRIDELPKGQPLVIHCHHGRRSAQATAYLLQQGFTDVRNLEGGIDAWSVKIDPDVPRY